MQPYINFLTTPIPGTPAFTDNGITIGLLLGPQFGLFIAAIVGLNDLLAPLATLAAEDTSGSGWIPAFATTTDVANSSGGAEQYLHGAIPDKSAESKGFQNFRYQQYLAKQAKASAENAAETSSSSNKGVAEDTSETANAERAAAAESGSSTAGSDGESEMFNKSKSGTTTNDAESADKNPSTEQSGSKEPEKKMKKPGGIGGGISGGDILLDALDFNVLSNIYHGVNSDLLRVQLPTLTVSYTFTKVIPVAAFPPLVIILGLTVQLDITFNFGWDTEGFFWNADDLKTGAPTPLFDFSATFSVGLGLDFGLVVVSVSIFFIAKVSFIWNDVTGTGPSSTNRTCNTSPATATRSSPSRSRARSDSTSTSP